MPSRTNISPMNVGIPGLPDLLKKTAQRTTRISKSITAPVGQPQEIAPSKNEPDDPSVQDGSNNWFALLAPLISTGIGALVGGKQGAAVGFSGGAQAGANYVNTKHADEQLGLENLRKEQQIELETRRTKATEAQSAATVAASKASTLQSGLNSYESAVKLALQTGQIAPLNDPELDAKLQEYINSPKYHQDVTHLATMSTEKEKTSEADRLAKVQQAETFKAQENLANQQALLLSRKAQDNQRYFDIINSREASDEARSDAMSKATKADGTPFFSPEAIEGERQKRSKRIGDEAFKDVFTRMVATGTMTVEQASHAAIIARNSLVSINGGKVDDVPLTDDQKSRLEIFIRQNQNKSLEKFEEMVYSSTDPYVNNPKAHQYVIERYKALKGTVSSSGNNVLINMVDWFYGPPATESSAGGAVSKNNELLKAGLSKPDTTR